MHTSSGFSALGDVQVSNQQNPEQQKKQKERLSLRREENEARHEAVFQILVKVRKILNSGNKLSVEEIQKINDSFEHFEALSRNFVEVESGINDEMDVNEIARRTEEEFKIVTKMEEIEGEVRKIMNMDRDEIKSVEVKDDDVDENELEADVSNVEQSELKGVENLSEQEQEVIEQSISGIKGRFKNIDTSDENVVAKFWKEITEEITEEGGMTGPALQKVMNVIRDNVVGKINKDEGGAETEEISWHEAKTEAEKYGKINKSVLKKLNSLKRALSQKDEEINKLKKGKERQVAIEDARKFRASVTRELYDFVQIQKEQDNKKREQNLEHKQRVNKLYDEVLTDAKQNHVESNAQIRDLVRDVEKQVRNKRKEISEANKKDRAFKIKELVDLKESLVQNLKNIIDEKIVADEKKKKDKKIARNNASRKTGEPTKMNANDNGRADKQKQFEVNEQEINDEINALFDSEGIEKYIGTGKSKKVQKNRRRIDTYKKEIIESIIEIENAAGRKINRGQFAIDYASEKQATAIAKILGDTVKRAYTEEQLKEIQKTRDAADITFTQMDKYNKEYDSLNASAEQAGDEKFKEVTREVWKEFAVRGFLVKDRETGEIKVSGKTNTDSKVSLYLLQKAGMSVKNVKYLAPGEYDPGKFNIDTGKQDGLIILDDGTVIIDHHGENSPLDTSAAGEVYDILARLGMLEKNEDMDRLIEFVNQVDNFDYPNAQKYFKNYFENAHKTILGTYRMLPPKVLEDFFAYKDNKTGKPLSPTEPLSIALRRKFYIENQPNSKKESRGQKVKKNIEEQHKRLEQMEKDGLIVESDRYGKICVVTEGNFYNDAMRAYGCDTVIFWNKDENDVFISSLVGKPIEDTFDQGDNIRKTMWIKSKSSDDKLTMQLRDVLEKMTDGKLKISDKLQKILDTNGERTDRVELTEIESKYLTPYIERVQANIKFIDTLDFSDLKGKQIAQEKKKLVSMVWKELEDDINKSMRFTSGQTEDIIELIKDKI